MTETTNGIAENVKASVHGIRKLTDDLVKNIRNGVNDTYGHRAYDAIDFLPISEHADRILTYARNNTNAEKMKVIRMFYEVYVYELEIPSDKYDALVKKSGEIEVGCDHDANGMPIANTGIKITDQEKYDLIKYLEDHNIPVTRGTYRSILNRYKKALVHYKNNSLADQPKVFVLTK